jgi:hypothetical protein
VGRTRAREPTAPILGLIGTLDFFSKCPRPVGPAPGPPAEPVHRVPFIGTGALALVLGAAGPFGRTAPGSDLIGTRLSRAGIAWPKFDGPDLRHTVGRARAREATAPIGPHTPPEGSRWAGDGWPRSPGTEVTLGIISAKTHTTRLIGYHSDLTSYRTITTSRRRTLAPSSGPSSLTTYPRPPDILVPMGGGWAALVLLVLEGGILLPGHCGSALLV